MESALPPRISRLVWLLIYLPLKLIKLPRYPSLTKLLGITEEGPNTSVLVPLHIHPELPKIINVLYTKR